MEPTKITAMLEALFVNTNALLVVLLIGAVTEALKRVAEKILGWEQKRVYVALLPLVPETLGMLIALIPGTLPDAMNGVALIVKLGFGIAAGMVSSKLWKIVTTFAERPDTSPAPAVVPPPEAPPLQ
jgi:hypothetical protein